MTGSDWWAPTAPARPRCCRSSALTGSDGFRILARESLLDLGFLGITKRQIASPDGVLFDRIVIEHPGAVAVVPIRDDTVTLLHQYRAPADQWMLEIPAGKLDVSGEELIPAAQRELLEETGLTGGAFDITYRALAGLYRRPAEGRPARLPTAVELRRALGPMAQDLARRKDRS